MENRKIRNISIFWKAKFLNYKLLYICLSLELYLAEHISGISSIHTATIFIFQEPTFRCKWHMTLLWYPTKSYSNIKDLAEVFGHFLDMFALHPHNYRPLFERLRTTPSILIGALVLSCLMLPSFLHTFGSYFSEPQISIAFHKVHIFWSTHKTCTTWLLFSFPTSLISLALL